MKIPCSVVRDLLPLYAEEMIEEETRALVDEHLEECSECSQKLEEIKAAAAVPAENTAVDTAKPLLALKKTINKRRRITAAIAALCVFILLFSAFHRINEWHQVPWEEGLIQVTGVEKMADVEKRNSPFPEEEEAIRLPDESMGLTIQFDSKISGIHSTMEKNENGTTEIIQGWITVNAPSIRFRTGCFTIPAADRSCCGASRWTEAWLSCPAWPWQATRFSPAAWLPFPRCSGSCSGIGNARPYSARFSSRPYPIWPDIC